MSLTALHAANSVEVGSVEGAVGDEVTLAVDIDISSADVVAAEIHIPLPEGVTPGGCTVVDNRFPDHSPVADVNNGEYVIVLFNLANKAMPVASGHALDVTLSLGENPGVFDLKPQIKFSDAAGNAVAGEAAGGRLTILGARLQLGDVSVDFGRVPIRSTVTRTVRATNTGTTVLEFGNITTTVPGLSVAPAVASLEPGAATDLTLTYAPTERAAKIDGRFTVNSNSVGRAPFTKVYSVPFSVNELHMGSAEGISDSEVEVTVKMNNMEPIVGAELSVTLPEALDFVDESVVLGDRAKDMSVATSVDVNRVLRIVMFNLTNKAATGDDGDLLSFRLKLVGRSGYYYLQPENVILCNAAGENMVSATSDGYVNISSPSMSGSSSFSLGNVPISGTATFNYTFSNYSSVPLTIEKVNFLNDVAMCGASFPMVVEPYASGSIPVTIANPQLGAFATTMNVYTNDPDNRLKAVDVSGSFYTANEMHFGAKYQSGCHYLVASLTNEREIAALQLDVVVPDGASIASDALTLSSRGAAHSATVAQVDKSRYRIVVFSLQNEAFDGGEGELFAIAISGDNLEGRQVRIESTKLSSIDGNNYTTPGSEAKLLRIPVYPHEIALSTTEMTLIVNESAHIAATVGPDNATDKSVEWTSSDPKIATVDADGNVVGVDEGTATIRATATANSDVVAECVVTVNPIPDGVDDAVQSDVEITAEHGLIKIDGLCAADRLRLYNLSGLLLADRQNCSSSETLQVAPRETYILLIDGKAYKILVP